MMQIIELTPEEKIKMYMKCSKLELVTMLIECNRLLQTLKPQVVVGTCNHSWYQQPGVTTNQWKCKSCGCLKLDSTLTLTSSNTNSQFSNQSFNITTTNVANVNLDEMCWSDNFNTHLPKNKKNGK